MWSVRMGIAKIASVSLVNLVQKYLTQPSPSAFWLTHFYDDQDYNNHDDDDVAELLRCFQMCGESR